jgi:hypothetical protein
MVARTCLERMKSELQAKGRRDVSSRCADSFLVLFRLQDFLTINHDNADMPGQARRPQRKKRVRTGLQLQGNHHGGKQQTMEDTSASSSAKINLEILPQTYSSRKMRGIPTTTYLKREGLITQTFH